MHPLERMKPSSVLIQTISTDALSNGKSKAQSSVERYGCGVKIHIYICWDGNEKSHWKDTEEAGQLPPNGEDWPRFTSHCGAFTLPGFFTLQSNLLKTEEPGGKYEMWVAP